METWHVKKPNGKTFGPFTSGQLKEFASQEELSTDDWLKNGDSKWIKAAAFQGLFDSDSVVVQAQVSHSLPAKPQKRWLWILPVGCLGVIMLFCFVGLLASLVQLPESRVHDLTGSVDLDSTKVLTSEFFNPAIGVTSKYSEANYVMDRPDNVLSTSVSLAVCPKANTLDVYPFANMPDSVGFVLEIRLANGFVQVRRGGGGAFGVETKWNHILKLGAKPGDLWVQRECSCKYRVISITGDESPTATIEVIKENSPDDDVAKSLFPLEPNLGGEGSKYVLEFQIGRGLAKCESFSHDSQFGWMKRGTQKLISIE